MSYNPETKLTENTNKPVKERQLTSVRPIDVTNNLENIYVGGTKSSLSLSQSSISVLGDITCSGTLRSSRFQPYGDYLTIQSDVTEVSANTLRMRNPSGGGATIAMGNISTVSSYFNLGGAGGSSTGDSFLISCLGNAATQISTTDAAGTDAYITITADGYMSLIAATTNTLQANSGDITLDASTGIYKFLLDSDADDLATVTVAANGATTIATSDSDGTAGHLTLDVNGDITLDSDTGEFIAKKGGTEFSAANSAYAGMILAYTVIGESTTHTTYAMTTSLAVPDANMNVSFVAPPSGNVEIMVQFHRDSSSSNKFVYVSLSDNATFNALGNTYTQISGYADETDDYVVNHYWTVTGLTAGSSYQYWFGIRTNGTTTNMKWGGTAGNRFCDFIMKATALPETLGGE